MEILQRRSGDVAILELSGRMAVGVGDLQAREEIAALLAAGERKVLIGMAGITVLDSSGVGELVRARAVAARAGAEIKLAEPSACVSEVLKVTRLTEVFEIYDKLDEGIVSYG